MVKEKEKELTAEEEEKISEVLSSLERKHDWWSEKEKQLQKEYEDEECENDEMYDKGKIDMLVECKSQRDKDVSKTRLEVIKEIEKLFYDEHRVAIIIERKEWEDFKKKLK